jgi:hypothetical protein
MGIVTLLITIGFFAYSHWGYVSQYIRSALTTGTWLGMPDEHDEQAFG